MSRLPAAVLWLASMVPHASVRDVPSPSTASSSLRPRPEGPGAGGACPCRAAARRSPVQQTSPVKCIPLALAAAAAVLLDARRAGAASASRSRSCAQTGRPPAPGAASLAPACSDVALAVTCGCSKRSSPDEPGRSLSPAPSRPASRAPNPLSAPAREARQSPYPVLSFALRGCASGAPCLLKAARLWSI